MAERVLITGGAGTLGQALTPLLLREGYGVRLVDVEHPNQPPGGAEIVQGDLRDPEAVDRAVHGVGAIVHAAAWHGVHLREHPAEDFWDLNVLGTRHVYEAAVEHGIKRVVFSSTMGVYGESRRPEADGPAVRIHEDLPRCPGEIYGLSKVLGEELAAYHERAHGIRGVALRYGMFVPEPFGHYGIRMLYGGVDERDVAAAVLASLRRLEREEGSFAAYNIESALPFDEDDGQALRDDPVAAIRRHWPDAPSLLEAADLKPWGPINEVFDIAKAGDELDWRPRYNFDQFLEALRRGIGTADEMPAAD
ncbi:MAG: NAD(P)-dependent oxidoreductase [Chloroflexi bacterium]|nr:NAD(P)-dependent oxidoreductase [Chloroflexota bacterium]